MTLCMAKYVRRIRGQSTMRKSVWTTGAMQTSNGGRQFLQTESVVRPHRTGTLIATFGDGSGTGTGGTDEMFVQGRDHDSPLEMWMDT
jgi:hypothetical protein